MSLKPQLSFASGELDPILHDRVTLERFQNGLATARNVMIGKTGTILSRFGRSHFVKTGYDNEIVNIYSPPNSGKVLEFGVNTANEGYVRIYDLEQGNLLQEIDEDTFGDYFGIDEDTIPNLHFVASGKHTYVFGGSTTDTLPLRVLHESPYGIDYGEDIFEIPSSPLSWTSSINGTGFLIDYAATNVINGEESLPMEITHPTDIRKPVDITEINTLTITIDNTIANIDKYNEVRIYQRPKEGMAFGFLGRTTNIYVDGAVIKAKFEDLGANADFTNGIPSLISKEGLSGLSNIGKYVIGTGVVYQQRLILGNFIDYDEEAILTSRPRFKNNFYRDFPYSLTSALQFKAGTSNTAKILRMIDSDGLVVFTSAGVFVSLGVLSPNNTVLEKRGDWIIDESIPPLSIPGGLFFVDKTNNSVRQLVYSQELSSYDSVDQSIFSDHLFKTRTINSWAYQQGTTPLIIVTFNDGSFATFTYSSEHKMRAWTRHDSKYPVEQVVSTGVADTTLFLINKNGIKYIEKTIPRYIPSDAFVKNPESDKDFYSGFMDGLKVQKTLLNDMLTNGDEFTLTPVVPDDWEGQLILNCGSSDLFTDPGMGVAGVIMRHFNLKDKSNVDLEIVSRTNDNEVVVTPSSEFPSDQSVNFRLYGTLNLITGLQHLAGEEVSVMVDGYVISSPNNDNEEDNVTPLVVSGFGTILLPEDLRAAITVVGRPVTADIKTLNVSTVEQSPTMIESLNVNKLYVRVHESRGLFVSNKFPEESLGQVDGDSVAQMQNLDNYDVPDNIPIVGNRFKQPISKRVEITMPGDWESNGQISFRQVDPIHFEILSIIADIEILRRGR